MEKVVIEEGEPLEAATDEQKQEPSKEGSDKTKEQDITKGGDDKSGEHDKNESAEVGDQSSPEKPAPRVFIFPCARCVIVS